MYRIHFDPKISKFVVQVQRFGLLWVTCTVLCIDREGPNDVYLTNTFDTYLKAAEYVTAIGLDTLYADKSANMYRAHMAGV